MKEKRDCSAPPVRETSSFVNVVEKNEEKERASSVNKPLNIEAQPFIKRINYKALVSAGKEKEAADYFMTEAKGKKKKKSQKSIPPESAKRPETKYLFCPGCGNPFKRRGLTNHKNKCLSFQNIKDYRYRQLKKAGVDVEDPPYELCSGMELAVRDPRTGKQRYVDIETFDKEIL